MLEDAGKLLQMLTAARRPRTKRFTLTVPEEMASRLEAERKKGLLDTTGNSEGDSKRISINLGLEKDVNERCYW